MIYKKGGKGGGEKRNEEREDGRDLPEWFDSTNVPRSKTVKKLARRMKERGISGINARRGCDWLSFLGRRARKPAKLKRPGSTSHPFARRARPASPFDEKLFLVLGERGSFEGNRGEDGCINPLRLVWRPPSLLLGPKIATTDYETLRLRE